MSDVRFYAWGNEDSQEFILAFFKDLGAKNVSDITCDDPNRIYFIDDLGNLTSLEKNLKDVILTHPNFQQYVPYNIFRYNVGDIVSVDRGNGLWEGCEIIGRYVKGGKPYYKLKYFWNYPETDIIPNPVSQFISHKTAKLLKECDYPQHIKSLAGYYYDENGVVQCGVPVGEHDVACSYIDDVLRWFRVEQKINIIPTPSKSGKSWEYFIVPEIDTEHRSPYRSTFEEIADEGIQHVCEYLINVKNNKFLVKD